MQPEALQEEKPPTTHQQLQDCAFKLLERTSLESYLATHARKLPNEQKPEVVILDEKATIASTLKVRRKTRWFIRFKRHSTQ